MIDCASRSLIRLALLTLVLVGCVGVSHTTADAQASSQPASDQPTFSFLLEGGLPAIKDGKARQSLARTDALLSTPAHSELLYLPIISTNSLGVDETLIIHSSPVYISDIQGRVYTNGLMPTNIAVVHTAELGTNGKDPATWAVGDFTGFYPPNAPEVSQRSLNVDVYGDSAIQMHGFDIGLHLQSKPPSSSFPWQLAQYYYGFDPTIYPWAYGPHARFCIDLDAAVPTSVSEAESINYAYVAFAAVDKLSDEVVWVSLSQYDERQELLDRGDFAHWWAEAGDPIALGVYGGGRYSSLIPGSSTSTSETWDEWRQFGYCISFSQMRTLLQDINNDFNLGISESPEHYGIKLFGVGPEMYIAGDSQSTMSMRVRDVYAFTINSPEEEITWDRSTIRSAAQSGETHFYSP